VVLDLLAAGFGLVYEALHDFGVFAGVDGQHAAPDEGTVLLGHCFVLVFGIDVLEDFLGGEWFAVVVVAFDPQPWRVVILVIGDIDVILPEIFYLLVELLLASDRHEAVLVFDLALDDFLFC
jgi:hypothetical protein